MIDWISVLLGTVVWVLLVLPLAFAPSRFAERAGEAAQPSVGAQQDEPRRSRLSDNLGAVSQRALLARGRRGRALNKAARLAAKSRTGVARAKAG